MRNLYVLCLLCVTGIFTVHAATKGFAPMQECETITLMNGLDIQGRIVEVNQEDIVYRPCDSADMRTVLIDKKEVFSILHANGKKEVLNEFEIKGKGKATSKSNIEILGVLSFVSAVLLSVVPPIALVLGFMSLAKFRREPNLWVGKGFAIAGIVLSFLALIYFLVIIASLF